MLDHRAIKALREIQRVVDEQSNDKDLWDPRNWNDPGLKALRALHDTIERFTIAIFEKFEVIDGDKSKIL